MKTPKTDAALDENWWFTKPPSLNPEFADFARELERENARLRAIFPRILDALQSGACSPDCTVDFLEQIPNEVRLVMRRFSLPNDAGQARP